jgi:arylsulfatase A-like enzyme
MQRRTFLRQAGGACAAPLFARPLLSQSSSRRPNIVVILADDIGYGDLGCYGGSGARTPNMDRLASQGVRFTDAYSPSATCTPTRYAMLTGEYAFRRKGSGVLPGNAPMLIEPGRPTVASVLKEAGYATGCVGKWHLGLGSGDLDWNGDIKPGPLELGFDYCYLIPATGDRVPCVYVENHRVVGLDPKDPIRVAYDKPVSGEPLGRERPDLLTMKFSRGHDMEIVNGISRIGYMTGGKAARWVDEDMADAITRQAVSFMEKNRANPFFLYFATHDIHVPRMPHKRFQGKSPSGYRGDAIEQLDWSVGRIMATLDRLRLAENTLLIFTSDNGPVLDDGYIDGAVEKLGEHKPAGPLRGGKYSIYEGGTRMPFLARWPARVKRSVSNAMISQVDLLATFGALAGRKLPEHAGPDSFNVLPALLGESRQGREYIVEHAQGLAIRKGPWKLIPAGQGVRRELGTAPWTVRAAAEAPLELYNLASDIGETRNVAAENPEFVRELSALLEKVRSSPRTRP